MPAGKQAGLHHLSNLGFPAVLLIASLVTRRSTLMLLTLYAAACAGWLVFGELLGLYTPPLVERSVPGDFFNVFAILIVTALMARVLTEAFFHSNLEVQHELHERQRAEARLAHDALHDALTGLPNRTLFNDRLQQRFEHARRRPTELFAVLLIDLDRFKVINDSLGHAIGDRLLVASAQHLLQCLRPEDTVARLGGDEFAVLVNDFQEMGDVIRIAERVQAQLASAPLVDNLNRDVTASIGIAVFSDTYPDPAGLLRDADSAVYHAKAKGPGRYEVFNKAMYTNALARLQLEADLKHAVENREWVIYYQPIVALSTGAILGAEALVRWQHPRRGLLNPADFIPVAEEAGYILPIGEYVLRTACAQLKTWRVQHQSDLWVSINLSVRQFKDPRLLTSLENVLAQSGLPDQALHLEVTESTAMDDLELTTRILNQIDLMGVKIWLDDFGSGYSSLSYLNRFPFHTLKIDRSFVRDLGTKPSSESLAKAILSMSQALNLEAVAEGVETEQQRSVLTALGCDKIQGYLISPPVPAAEFSRLLR